MRPGGRRVLEPGETIGASFMPLGRSGAVTAVAFLVADLVPPLAAVFLGLRALSMALEPHILALTLCVCMAGSLMTLFVVRLPPLAKAGSPKRIYTRTEWFGISVNFYADSPRTLGDFSAGCGHVVTGAIAGLASNRVWFACRHGHAHPRPGDFTRCRWQPWSGCIFRRRAGRGAAPGNGQLHARSWIYAAGEPSQ
jgi:hypothetical protein